MPCPPGRARSRQNQPCIISHMSPDGQPLHTSRSSVFMLSTLTSGRTVQKSAFHTACTMHYTRSAMR
jgi:hypothetical protein